MALNPSEGSNLEQLVLKGLIVSDCVLFRSRCIVRIRFVFARSLLAV